MDSKEDCNGEKYPDDDWKKFNIPPPNYSLKQSIDEEIPSFEYSWGDMMIHCHLR